MKPTSCTRLIPAVLTLSVSAFVAVCLGADNVGDALRLKAMDGDVKAMKELGDYYLGEYRTEDGKFLATKKNRTEAAKWYRQAAQKGDISAMKCLVRSYQLPVEREERLNWLTRMGKAANDLSGDERRAAFLFVSDAYIDLEHPNDGRDWMFRACDLLTNDWHNIQPVKIACVLRGEGLRGESKPGTRHVVDFPAHARFLRYAIAKDLPDHGDYGDNVLLQTLMGEAYERGLGVAQDIGEAYKWYARAVDYAKTRTCKRTECVGYAQRRLGECLRYGKGCKRNLKEAVKWYERAALNKDLEARNQFAEWCLSGLVDIGDHELTAKQAEGSHAILSLVAGDNMPTPRYVIEPDINRAEELSDTHVYSWCDPQEVIAAHRLCKIYIWRNDWEKVVKLSQGWHEWPKNPFQAKMKYWLSSAYLLGKGVAVDKSKGNELLKEAAQLGDPEAMEVLDKLGTEYNVKRVNER